MILQQYNQQQQMYQGQGQNQVNMIPPQPQIPNSQSQPNSRNGPIYVPSNVSKVNQQQQQQMQPPLPPQQQIPNASNMFAPPPMQQQVQQQQQQVQQVPPQAPPMMNNYGHAQANGGYGNPGQYGSQIVSFLFFNQFLFSNNKNYVLQPMPPQVPQVSSPPQAVPPPPDFGNGMSAPAPPQVFSVRFFFAEI